MNKVGSIETNDYLDFINEIFEKGAKFVKFDNDTYSLYGWVAYDSVTIAYVDENIVRKQKLIFDVEYSDVKTLQEIIDRFIGDKKLKDKSKVVKTRLELYTRMIEDEYMLLDYRENNNTIVVWLDDNQVITIDWIYKNEEKRKVVKREKVESKIGFYDLLDELIK